MLPVLATPASMAGQWGGDRLNVTITDKATVLSLDCGGGSFVLPSRLGPDGSFKVDGHFAVYRPGPERADAPSAKSDASFTGKVVGDSMSLTIAAPGEPKARHFNLTRDGRPVAGTIAG